MVFFAFLLFIFTIIPRITLTFIGRLLEFKEWDSWKSLFKNSLALFTLYFLLSLPFAFILYQALGNQDQQFPKLIFVTVFLSLIAVRLSILLEKQKYLQKWGFNFLDRINPEKLKKSALRNEYRSYLFSVFVSGFIFGILLLIVKIITFPEGTLLIIPPINFIPKPILESVGRYTFDGTVLFLLSLSVEFLLKKAGYYKIEIE